MVVSKLLSLVIASTLVGLPDQVEPVAPAEPGTPTEHVPPAPTLPSHTAQPAATTPQPEPDEPPKPTTQRYRQAKAMQVSGLVVLVSGGVVFMASLLGGLGSGLMSPQDTNKTALNVGVPIGATTAVLGVILLSTGSTMVKKEEQAASGLGRRVKVSPTVSAGWSGGSVGVRLTF